MLTEEMHYDALSGKGMGIDFLGMSGTIVTLMLDGLSKTGYRVRKFTLPTGNPVLLPTLTPSREPAATR
jgi:hypothetical protein